AAAAPDAAALDAAAPMAAAIEPPTQVDAAVAEAEQTEPVPAPRTSIRTHRAARPTLAPAPSRPRPATPRRAAKPDPDGTLDAYR
ncbi:MAG: hypothetical protein ACTHU0_37595, partial [Kofleriaceae bacterium]